MNTEDIVAKIEALSPEKRVEVVDFIDFLRERSVARSADEKDVRARLQEIVDRMKSNTFTGDPPRFTREDLHERR